MGLESPLKAEGPVGGKLLFELDRWMGGGTIIVAGAIWFCAICARYVFVQAVSVRHANVLVMQFSKRH